jgi:hypothetical protein
LGGFIVRHRRINWFGGKCLQKISTAGRKRKTVMGVDTSVARYHDNQIIPHRLSWTSFVQRLKYPGNVGSFRGKIVTS